jgi:hypothetical protein
MGFVCDTVMWRVYSAEQSLEEGRRFESLEALWDYVYNLAPDLAEWWGEHYGERPGPDLKIEVGGEEWPEDGLVASYASPDQEAAPRMWTISFHPQMATEVVVLHELAHCLAPRYYGDVARLRRQLSRRKIVDVESYHGHGPMFAATLVSLLHRYGNTGDHAELQEAYQHFEVPIASAEDFTQACHDQHQLQQLALEIEESIRAWCAELDAKRPSGNDRNPAQQTSHTDLDTSAPAEERPATCVPRDWWGRWLFLSRRQGKTITFRSIAEAVSRAQPCSPRAISRLERIPERPSRPRDLRIAMATAAFLGLDPVWVRTACSLSPHNCHITLEELRAVNPAWVDDVEHLNQLGATRPSKWDLSAHR